ncbi:MAG TPA: DUF294 nucleotidyltransferase-like domain-containing protein, partial [Rubrivivax sp.]|nr:DUF294 nucleotidyltransferase-like domain-containing protein [Rubrivivax sp.]
GAVSAGAEQAVAGDLFPLAEVLQGRPVAVPWVAKEDTFCLQVPAPLVESLAADSPPFADFLHQRVLHWLEMSQRSLQASYAEQALTGRSLDAPLATFVKQRPLMMTPATPLGDALQAMHQLAVGSVLVVDDAQHGVGILTRHDLLERVLLPQRALDTPLVDVMSQPLRTLDSSRSAHDAALLMSTHGVRHVPITEHGRVVGIVSERDLFALQRLSLRQVADVLRGADSVDQLREAAADIRRLAGQLFAQGVQARTITELISRLNDRLTVRLVELMAAQQQLNLQQACWLVFGSEGRSEQTVATDQDNGLVFVSPRPHADRARWLALGRSVNEALDRCGYPLCKGGIMAGNPECCLSSDEWQQRFTHWIDHGAPSDLLQASIFFDLRPLVGNAALVSGLRELITNRAAATPRFIKQLADNALVHRPPLHWLGGIATNQVDGAAVIDLKLQASGLFVEAARLLALAHGVPATGTRQRLEGAAPAMGVPPAEAHAWAAAFEHLQFLRLHAQLGPQGSSAPNLCRIDALNDFDRRMLRESLRVAQRLQKRIELDWLR